MLDVKCPRCGGIVKVPTVVHFRNKLDLWAEHAHCTRCGVNYQWYDGTRERPPAGSPGTPMYQYYTGWYCDRPLDAPSPIEVKGLGPVHD
jgi:endogenous inhibitor of DNA gyrase (YacG/DUF329 family)